MAEITTSDTRENMGEVKYALQRAGFLAREREIDDALDSETWTALYLFAESRGFKWSLEAFEAEDGVVPPAVTAALLDPMAALSFSALEDEGDLVLDDDDPPPPATVDLATVEVFDLTGEHGLDEKKARQKPRSLDQITTIVLHQTGVKFGVGSRALEKYGKRVALHRRFYDVACHVAALMNGDVLLVNPWQRYVLHGHGSNRFSIGVEIEGVYPGIAGKLESVSGAQPPNELTTRTIAAARKAVRISVEQCRALGCPITNIAAHRSFHGSRISDPGQEIWREVALWAVDALDLSIDYELAEPCKSNPRKSGLKIPRDWDPLGTVDYRGRALK